MQTIQHFCYTLNFQNKLGISYQITYIISNYTFFIIWAYLVWTENNMDSELGSIRRIIRNNGLTVQHINKLIVDIVNNK